MLALHMPFVAKPVALKSTRRGRENTGIAVERFFRVTRNSSIPALMPGELLALPWDADESSMAPRTGMLTKPQATSERCAEEVHANGEGHHNDWRDHG
jgi:hypothetical protein